MKSLPDVNVLIALLDADHPHHFRAVSWFLSNFVQGWATCPLTENGCVRILSQPSYANTISIMEASSRLRSLTNIAHYEFVADDISLFDGTTADIRLLSGHRQLTDAYLLALAVKNEMRLVTLDTRIRLDAVMGASESNLVVI